MLAIFICRDLFDDLFVKVYGKSVKGNKDAFCVDLLEEFRSITNHNTSISNAYHIYMCAPTHFFFLTQSPSHCLFFLNAYNGKYTINFGIINSAL